MHKSLIGLAAAASLGLATAALPSSANAGCFGCAVAGGVLGGVILGSAIANAANPPPPPGYYGYPPPPAAYGPPPPEAYGPPPAYAGGPPSCHYEKRRVWVEEVQGYRIRPVQICP
jgi:hypothetical protein